MAELAHRQIQLVVKKEQQRKHKKFFDYDDTKKLAEECFSREKISEDNLMRYDVNFVAVIVVAAAAAAVVNFAFIFYDGHA